MERYTYRPLDRAGEEIRVLDVLSGSGKQTVRCRVRHISLTSNPTPEYETISYCWGDASLRWYIIVDGSILNVPASASKALARMRRKRSTRTLWIDAVCINQNDIREREWQVGLMKEVFLATVCCLVFLGDGDKLAKPAFRSLQILQDTMAKDTSWYSQTERERIDVPVGVNVDAVAALYSEPWFTRLWVLQEVALPHKTLCHWGSLVYEFRPLALTARFLFFRSTFTRMMDHQDFSAHLAAVSTMADVLLMGEARPRHMIGLPLTHLYEFAVTLQASNKHDYVYAVLGMCQTDTITRLQRLLESSYTKSLQDVFRDATRATIEESTSIDILAQARQFASQSNDTPLHDCPSWVVTWGHTYEEAKSHLRPEYAADNHSAMIYKHCTLDQNLLQLGGVEVCRVVSIGPSYPNPSSTAELACAMMDIIGFCLNSAEWYIHSGSGIRNLTDIGPALVGGENIFCGRTSRQACVDMLGLRAHLVEHGEIPRLGVLDDYATLLMVTLSHRKVFTTTSGQVGVGPDNLEVHDRVVVLYGSHLPFILRPVGDEFRMKGTCYLQGIMDGEAVRQHKADGKEDKIFDIR